MNEADVVRAWMRRVMDDKGWSAERWARIADTSPTNITRFLRGARHLPSARTLSKLAAVAGSAPELGRDRLRVITLQKTVSVFLQSQVVMLTRGDRGAPEPKPIESTSTMQSVSDQAFAFRVTGDRLVLRGVVEGDLIIAEPVAVLTPRPGDVVLYRCDDDPHGSRLGELQAGGIITHAGVRHEAPVSITDHPILAVCIEVQRALRSPNHADADPTPV